LKGRSVSALLSSKDHDGVARKLKAQEVSWPKLDTSAFFFGAAGDDTEPARFFSVESTLLSARLVTVEFNECVGISLALPALEDNVLVE
jgi:hypothetical protein